jgi:hypothetical protein
MKNFSVLFQSYSEVGAWFIFLESSLYSSSVDVGTLNVVYSVRLNGICLSASVYFVLFFFWISFWKRKRAHDKVLCIHSRFLWTSTRFSFCCPIQWNSSFYTLVYSTLFFFPPSHIYCFRIGFVQCSVYPCRNSKPLPFRISISLQWLWIVPPKLSASSV